MDLVRINMCIHICVGSFFMQTLAPTKAQIHSLALLLTTAPILTIALILILSTYMYIYIYIYVYIYMCMSICKP